jgi:hypothetical protein
VTRADDACFSSFAVMIAMVTLLPVRHGYGFEYRPSISGEARGFV